MKKYRIKIVNDVFYPQVKILFLWTHFDNDDNDDDYVYFCNEEDCRDFIIKQQTISKPIIKYIYL